MWLKCTRIFFLKLMCWMTGDMHLMMKKYLGPGAATVSGCATTLPFCITAMWYSAAWTLTAILQWETFATCLSKRYFHLKGWGESLKGSDSTGLSTLIAEGAWAAPTWHRGWSNLWPLLSG